MEILISAARVVGTEDLVALPLLELVVLMTVPRQKTLQTTQVRITLLRA